MSTPKNKLSVLEYGPRDHIETIVALVLEHPGECVEELATERGIPAGFVRHVLTEPRFAVLIARRSADAMARDAVPAAVKLLQRIATGQEEAPPQVKVQAANTILRHADRYLAGYIDKARAEQDLAEMPIEDLRELVQQGEARLASEARDVSAPDSAPDPAPSAGDDLKFLLS